MADTKISDLTALTGANVADDDEFVIVDTSAAQSKRITKTELAVALGTNDTLADVLGKGNTTGGTDISVSSGDDITFADNSKAIFGAGSDLQVYSDGTTGQLVGNVNVTGTVTADGLTVDGDGYFGGTTVAGTDYPLRIQNKDTGIAAGVGIEFSIDSVNNVIGSTIRSDRTGAAYHQSALTFSTRRANGSGLVDAAKIDQNGDISFYDSTGTSQNLFWDASASALGIGTTSPSTILTLDSGGTPTTLKIDSLTESSIDFDDKGGSAKRYKIGTNISSNDGQFEFKDMTANAERMRLTSTGQLLIGRTATSGVADGHRFDANGFTQHVRDGGEALEVVRETSDGSLVVFKKDGTTVGSIGSRSGVVSYIVLDPRTSVKGAALIGGSIGTTTGVINPGKNDGDIADAAIDLGSTYARFKDLYLSGGVYVGGTGSANYLDDYEEGEYSPTLYGSTTGTGSPLPLRSTYDTLTYTKIGRQVTIGGKLETLGSHSATGVLSLSLPFTVADQTDAAGNSVGAIMLYRTGNYQDNPVLLSGQNQSTAYFIQNTSGGDLANILAENMDSAIEIFLSLTFFTAS